MLARGGLVVLDDNGLYYLRSVYPTRILERNKFQREANKAARVLI